MSAFILWYLVITILGWLTFPLAYQLFPALKDRGYTLTRALGLLVWGYIFWLFASLGIAQNDTGGLLLALIVLISLSTWISLRDRGPKTVDGDSINGLLSIVEWVKKNLRLIITTELLFFI